MVFSTGWASGVNAYLVVLMLGLLGRLTDVGGVPDALTRTDVLVVAGALYAMEFVADKIPYLDSTWDAISTAEGLAHLRPWAAGALRPEAAAGFLAAWVPASEVPVQVLVPVLFQEGGPSAHPTGRTRKKISSGCSTQTSTITRMAI